MIRAIIKSITEAANNVRKFSASGRPGETISNREIFQHYGFASRPLEGAEAIIIRDGNHLIMIADEDRRYRVELDEGEVVLSSHDGSKVHLKKDGEILIASGAGDTIEMTKDNEIKVTAQSKVVIDAAAVELGATTLEAVLKGEAFMNWANTHYHIGGFTVPTSSPAIQANALLHLSTKVKAQ